MNAISEQEIADTSLEPPSPISLMGMNFGVGGLVSANVHSFDHPGCVAAGDHVGPHAQAVLHSDDDRSTSPAEFHLVWTSGATGWSKRSRRASGGNVLKSPADVYVGFMQSETVESALVHQFHLLDRFHVKRVSQARKLLEGVTTIDAKSKDGFIRLSVVADTPEHAMELANGYIDTTKELSKHLAVGEASQRRLFLETQLEQAKDKLASAEESLRRTENTTGVIQVEAQSRALIEAASNLRSQIAAKEVRLKSLHTFAADDNADVRQAVQELAALRAQLANLNRNDNVLSSTSGLAGSQGQISNSGLEYVRKVREVKYQETIFEILARQFEAAKLDEAREGNLLQVVDPARRPDYRTGPKRALIIAACFVIGLFGSLSFLLLQLVFRRQLTHPLIAERVTLLKHNIKAGH